MKDPTGKAAPAGGFKVGGWYSGYQYNGSGFSQAAGVASIGDNAGKDVPAQNSADAAYISQQKIAANQIQAPASVPLPTTTPQTEFVTGLTAEQQTAKQGVQQEIANQQASIDAKMAAAKGVQTEALGQIKSLTTPFRQATETQMSNDLHVNTNFEANQKLVDELDSLLTQGNDLIRQQKDVTGLSAIRNPRIQQTMDDVAARAGVIQAVISARNGQISVAQNMIDRTVNAIAADRKDQISYYQTVLDLNNQDIIRLSAVDAKLADEKLQQKKDELTSINKTVDYVKQLMLDPNTAQILADGGVKLTDNIATINQKIATVTYAKEVSSLSNEMVAKGAEVLASPAGVPKDELRVLTDSRGQKHYYRVIEDKTNKGTAAERSVSSVASNITQNNLNFPDAVMAFANQMSLSDIYSAYAQSAMGQKYGLPSEDPQVVAIQYKLAKGEITRAEAEAFLQAK